MRTLVESGVIDDAFVETWYDDRSENWITQLRTPSGFQVGDAMFAGNRDTADANHEAMLEEAEGRLHNYVAIVKSQYI